MAADVVIRGGTIVDGTGGPAYRADIAIEGGRITRIGRCDGPAREEIDARDRIVTPGFVDIHTHLDAQLIWDPLGSPSNQHGVTSVVVGNCGVGFAPCRPEDRDYLMFLMQGVEDIPVSAMAAGIDWNWQSFPEYLDSLDARPLGLNVGAHLSHAPLRIHAMGQRGATAAPANDDELVAMRTAVVEAMRAGALGVSTGRTTMHRTPSGDPVPGTFADRRELDALASGLAATGTGVLEIIPLGGAGEDAEGWRREYEWMLPISLESARPLSVGLVQCLAYPDAWRDVLRATEEAQLRGARIVPQVAVRSVGLLMGFGISVSPLWIFPAAGELASRPVDEIRAALRDADLRQRLLESVRNENGAVLGGMATVDQVFALEGEGAAAYELTPEQSIGARARREGRNFGELILEHILRTDLRGFFIVPLFNPDLDAVGAMLSHPLTGIGLGDSGAHTTQTSDASYSTFLLSWWVRQRRLLTIEQAIRKLTFDPASLWGLRNRGVIRHGAHADLNVIDLDRIDIGLPELRHEMPGGAPHLTQTGRGYDATLVNGQILMRHGTPTAARPGRVLRNELWG